MPFKTADLTDEICDENCEEVQVAGMSFKSYGGKSRFHGEIVTLKLFEDNQLVRDQVNSNGKGKVLVVDGGASMRRAYSAICWQQKQPKMAGQGYLSMAVFVILLIWQP